MMLLALSCIDAEEEAILYRKEGKEEKRETRRL